MNVEEKILERVKADLGTLISDDELRDFIHKGIEQTLFKPRYKVTNSYGGKEELPPLINEIVLKVLQERYRELVADWLTEHADEIEAVAKEVLASGASKLLADAISHFFREQMCSFELNVAQKLRSGAI